MEDCEAIPVLGNARRRPPGSTLPAVDSTFLIRQVCKWLPLTSSHDLDSTVERIRSTASAIVPASLATPVSTTFTVQRREGCPQPLHRPPPRTPSTLGGCSQNTKDIGNKLTEITRVFLCCSAIFSRDTSANGPQPVSKPRPEVTPVRVLPCPRSPPLAFFRLEVSSSSRLPRPTIAPRTGGRHTKSRRRRSRDKLKLRGRCSRAHGFQTVSTV